MTKYIIKNCPCYVYYEGILHLCCDGQGDGYCQDCTDCLIKRIVERCKETKEMFSNLPDSVAFDLIAFLGSNLHEELLSMLEIEECEG